MNSPNTQRGLAEILKRGYTRARHSFRCAGFKIEKIEKSITIIEMPVQPRNEYTKTKPFAKPRPCPFTKIALNVVPEQTNPGMQVHSKENSLPTKRLYPAIATACKDYNLPNQMLSEPPPRGGSSRSSTSRVQSSMPNGAAVHKHSIACFITCR